MRIRRLLGGGLVVTALGIALATVATGGETDPVAECTRSAEQLWERALDARIMAEVDALPALNSLDGCRDLTAEEKEEFHRRNAQQEDRVAGHVIRLALKEGTI